MDQQEKKQEFTTEQKIKGIVFFIGGLFFIWLFFIPSCTDEKSEKKVYTESDALIHSRQFVEKKLKSPSTAEFPYTTEGVVKINDTTFTLNSYVDSQNGFGAMIRSNYSCKITFIPSIDKVQCDDLIIE